MNARLKPNSSAFSPKIPPAEFEGRRLFLFSDRATRILAQRLLASVALIFFFFFWWLCWVFVKVCRLLQLGRVEGRLIALRLVGCGYWPGITPIPLHLHWRGVFNHRTSRELLSVSLFIWKKQLDREKQADLLVFESLRTFSKGLGVDWIFYQFCFPWELASRGPRHFSEFLIFANQKLLANHVDGAHSC